MAKKFTAAQAAQNMRKRPIARGFQFTAAQAAQNTNESTYLRDRTFTAAQAAQKGRSPCCSD